MAKVDHLRLCNEHGIPFQDFEAQFCQRCHQPECSRSQHGKSKFEERVASWEDRLFKQIARLDPNDPRFQEITAHKFLGVAPGTAQTKSAWADPRDLETTKEFSIPLSPPAPPPPVMTVVEPPPVVMVEKPAELVQVLPPAPPATLPMLVNTPARPRQMIGGAEPNQTPSVLDPWQPKQPLQPGETLVKPGARIKFGS